MSLSQLGGTFRAIWGEGSWGRETWGTGQLVVAKINGGRDGIGPHGPLREAEWSVVIVAPFLRDVDVDVS